MEKQVIQSVGFRNITENGEITGFQLKIRLPYYRGVYLSQIKPGHLIVDGESFGEDEILWRVNGEDYTYAELRKNCKEHWHPMEPATLIVKKPGGLSQGFHDITYGFCCTHSYMPPFMEAQLVLSVFSGWLGWTAWALSQLSIKLLAVMQQ